MRRNMKSTILVSIAMLFLSSLLFGSPLFIAPASATSVPRTPINEVINATEGGTFVLSYKMYFNETDPGFFGLTFYWDQNESLSRPDRDKWNFTYQSFVAKFTTPPYDFTHPENITVTVEKRNATGPGGGPGVYRYSVTIDESYGEGNGTQASPKYFWVNVTMRAAGQSGGVYINHTAPADQNITCSSTFVGEGSIILLGEGKVKIHIAPFGVHDVAVIDKKIFRTVVGQGYKSEINVTVENQGIFTETFNVIVYYKNTTYTGIVGTQAVTNLGAGATKLLIFIWTTSGSVKRRQEYTIIANASTVPGEVDTADNSRDGATIKVTIPGDIDGDWYVYTKDLGKIGASWRAYRGQPKYIANADIDGDGYIYTKDLGKVGANWRKNA